jgi:hypothetical protein
MRVLSVYAFSVNSIDIHLKKERTQRKCLNLLKGSSNAFSSHVTLKLMAALNAEEPISIS